MPKYLNEAYADFLNMLQTKSVGFKVNFWKYEQNEVETSIAAAANRINFAVRDCVTRLSRIASDVTKTVPMQHEASRQIYDRLADHVAKDIAHIRTKADADATAARDRAFATIAPDPGKSSLYQEIRSYCMSRRTDPAFPAELSKMVRESRDVAAALNSAPGFLAGIGEDRRMGLVMDAVAHWSPTDTAAMLHATDVGKEADKIEVGMRKLKAAAYDVAQSNKARETFVDPAAPFAAPPVEAAE